jgi:TPR repeat protein
VGWIVRGALAGACWLLGGGLPGAPAQDHGLTTPSSLYDLHALRVLAEQGDKRAAFLLGARYASGRAGVQDDSEAVRWFTVAAQGGLAEAQYNLGIMYASGRGVALDPAQAARWYQRAAEQGLAEAQFNLGTLYGTGRGVPRDEALAATWLERAAGAGLPQAQYNLGVLYEHGRGVRLDASRALAWYQRAAEQGFEPARQRHAALGEKLRAPAAAPPTTAPSERAAATAVTAPVERAAATAVTAPVERAVVTAVADPGDWVASLDPEHYTLQLASYTERADAQRFADSFADGAAVGIYASSKRGARRYAVVHGVYASHQQASAAIAALPERLRNMKPWVRKVALIHAEMAR